MDRSTYPARKRRLQDDEDDTYLHCLTAAERLEMVWQLTLQALVFREEMQDEPRLRRDVVRVIRGRG